MTVTRADLPRVDGEVNAVAQTIESGAGRVYIGTNKGKFYKYNIITGAVSELQRLVGNITCMLYDASTYLYIGTDAGKIYRYTVSNGTITTLYTATDAGIQSLVLYSSKLYTGLTGGKFASITIS